MSRKWRSSLLFLRLFWAIYIIKLCCMKFWLLCLEFPALLLNKRKISSFRSPVCSPQLNCSCFRKSFLWAFPTKPWIPIAKMLAWLPFTWKSCSFASRSSSKTIATKLPRLKKNTCRMKSLPYLDCGWIWLSILLVCHL